MTFQITQMMDVGTDNPIVARLIVGFLDIIQITVLPHDDKEKIKKGCFEIMRSLVEAEKAAKPLIEEIRSAESRLATEGVKIQEPSKTIETPGILKLDNAAVFLMFAKQALQILAKTMGLLLKKDFNGPHFNKVRDEAIKQFGADHPVSKLLNEDHDWVKAIIDLRNEYEHRRSIKPFVRGFNISPMKDGKYLIDMPKFFNDTQISNGLEVYSHNLLTFSEEMIALTLANHLPASVTLYEVPDDQRAKDCPVRFRIRLKEGLTVK